MFALVIGITTKRCPAVPVKYVGLTQRTLGSPMDYINHRVKRRHMEIKRETVPIEQEVSNIHSVQRQSLSLSYKSLTIPLTQLPWYCMLFNVVWNHFKELIFISFSKKNTNEALSLLLNLRSSRLLWPYCFCLSTLDLKRESIWFTQSMSPPFGLFLQFIFQQHLAITLYLKQCGDWYTSDLPVIVEKNKIWVVLQSRVQLDSQH